MNAVDIAVLALVGAALAAAVIFSIRARKKRGGCGCFGCSSCSSCHRCHTSANAEKTESCRKGR